MWTNNSHIHIILEEDMAEDIILSAIAEMRDIEDAITINHEDVWK